MKTINIGSNVRLAKEGSKCHNDRRFKDSNNSILINTLGKVVATRRDVNGVEQYLVKFKGHGGNRHCNADEIKLVIR